MRARLVILALLLTGCAADPAAVTAPVAAVTRTSASPSAVPKPAEPSRAPAWVVGTAPLPLARDGFGRRLPTPAGLRDRRLPTKDLLPPPADGRFHASVAAIDPAVRTRMGQTYSPACPVPLSALRYVRLSFRGFDGRAHTGELVVHREAAPRVVRAFRALYAQRFPIEQMRLPTTADLRDRPTGDGSNTAAFVCRNKRGQTRLSSHASGTAVDVNPFHNPLVRRDLVLPELAGAYRDRSWVRPGMLLPGSPPCAPSRARASPGAGPTATRRTTCTSPSREGDALLPHRPVMHLGLTGG